MTCDRVCPGDGETNWKGREGKSVRTPAKDILKPVHFIVCEYTAINIFNR